MEEGGASNVCTRAHADMYRFAYPSLRKLYGVIVKLEPLSEQRALVSDETLAGLVQELANAITDYQV